MLHSEIQKNGILYVVGQLRSGGQERQLSLLLEHLSTEGVNISLLVWSYDENAAYAAWAREKGFELITLPPKMSKIDKIRALVRHVHKTRPALVHSFSFFTNFPVWLACVGTKVKPIGSIRSDYYHDKVNAGRILGVLSARYPRNIICNNYQSRVNAVKSLGQRPNRFWHIVRNGIDLKVFNFTENTNEPFCVIGVGSLIEVKRWDRFIDIAKIVIEAKPDIQFKIIGEGSLLESLQQKAANLDVSKSIEFLGYQKDVSAFIKKANLLLLTSDAEGCPNVVMEAMSIGRPVVASEVGDVPTLIDNTVDGFVFIREQVQAMAQCIIQLSENPSKLQEMSSNAYYKSKTQFGTDVMIRNMLKAYNDIYQK